MANAYKILGQVTATANTLANVYVVPAASAAVVNSIHVTNLSASNASFSIAVIPLNRSFYTHHTLTELHTHQCATLTFIFIG